MATSKKTDAAAKQLRHIHVRLNPAEASRVESDMNSFRETNVGDLRPGAYAKATVLAFPRYRRMEAELRELVREAGGGKVAARLMKLLEVKVMP